MRRSDDLDRRQRERALGASKQEVGRGRVARLLRRDLQALDEAREPGRAMRCQETHPDAGQCERDEGHVGAHIATRTNGTIGWGR